MDGEALPSPVFGSTLTGLVEFAPAECRIAAKVAAFIKSCF